jgi:hypothetical protein
MKNLATLLVGLQQSKSTSIRKVDAGQSYKTAFSEQEPVLQKRAGDRCQDFKNIFAQNLIKILLVFCKKMDHIIGFE